MSRSTWIESALSGIFIASALCAATPVLALEAKQCLTMAQMNEALKADGQRTMIIGDRAAVNDSSERVSGVTVNFYVNTVTSNDDGSLGYQLEGDMPRDQISTKVCVRAKLTNVHLFDARKLKIPDAAFLGGQFDAVVRENAAKGTLPMVIANTIHLGTEGKSSVGLPMVMFGNIEGRNASITTRLPNGKPQFLVLMGHTDYTAAGLVMVTKQSLGKR